MTQVEKNDEIKRQFWQYRRAQLAIIAVLAIGGLVLPKTPLLRGWEYKFTSGAVEIGKKEVPQDALRIKSVEEAVALFPNSKNPNLAEYLRLKGPQPFAAWSCEVLKLKALCLRYLWKENHALTVVVTTVGKRYKKKTRPFTKSGWGGYFFLVPENDLAFAVTGYFEPKDIKGALNLPSHPSVPATATPAPTAN